MKKSKNKNSGFLHNGSCEFSCTNELLKNARQRDLLQSGRSSISQLGSLGIKPLDIYINLQNTWITSFLVKQKHYILFLPLHSTHSKASIVLQTERHTLVTLQNLCITALCSKEQSYQLYPTFAPQQMGSGLAPQYMGCDFTDQIWS